MDTLQAERRDMSVKSQKLKREGYVPGSLFGHQIEGTVGLKIETKELERVLKDNKRGSRLSLMLDGKQYNVLVKDYQYNSMKRRYDQIDLQALVSGEMIQSVAKVEILNRDDVKEGVLQQELEEISYSAMPEDLIDKVEIDAAGLKLEEKICVGDLEMAKNPKIHLHTDPEAIVVVVARLHKAAEEETASEEAGETAAEG